MPAEAPRPGVTDRADAIEAAQSIATIEYGGESYKLAWRNLPMPERIICRKATGLPLETFTAPLDDTSATVFGEDSLCVLWWLARRAAGEWQLTFTKATQEWDVKNVTAFTVDIPDAEDIDPEA